MRKKLTNWKCLVFVLVTTHAIGQSRSSDLGVLGVEIGKTQLTEVQAKFGKSSEILRCSQSEEASKQVCYSTTGGLHDKVIFESGFSGGWTTVDGFTITAAELPDRCFKSCPTSELIRRKILTNNGLHLRMSREEIVRKLGSPTSETPEKLSFTSESRRSMTDSEVQRETETFQTPVVHPYWNVQTTTDVTLTHSKVVSIKVRQMVSY